MASLIFNLIAISFIMGFITDISRAPESLEEFIGKWLDLKNVHIKILECSLCQTWWLGLLFLIVSNEFSILNIAILAIISAFTFIWADLYNVIYTLITTLIRKLYELLQ